MPKFVRQEFEEYLECGLLEHGGLFLADPEHPSLDLVPDSSLDHLQAASVAYRIALGPRPRLNLTRFRGVFAPNFKQRKRIAPRRTTTRIDSDKPRAPRSWMQRLKRVFAMPQGTLS